MRLLEGHKGILYKVCRLYQDDPEDRQDLFQEIVAQLWVSYDGFRGESAYSTWMYRVALNTAIVFLKKSHRHREHFRAVAYPDLAEEVSAVQEKEERLAIFHVAVGRLNAVEKALVFCYMEGRSGEEAAAILGISPGNVRVRMNRVKEKLHQIIKIMGYEF